MVNDAIKVLATIEIGDSVVDLVQDLEGDVYVVEHGRPISVRSTEIDLDLSEELETASMTVTVAFTITVKVRR